MVLTGSISSDFEATLVYTWLLEHSWNTPNSNWKNNFGHNASAGKSCDYWTTLNGIGNISFANGMQIVFINNIFCDANSTNLLIWWKWNQIIIQLFDYNLWFGDFILHTLNPKYIWARIITCITCSFLNLG